MHKKRPVAKCFATGPVSLNLPNHVTLQKASVYTSRPEGGGLGRSPKTEGAIGRKAHLTAGDGASLRLSYFLPRFHEAARKIGVGYRQPPASTIPSANRNCTAHLLPQSPAVTAPSRRELWGLYLATLACCLWESACCESLSQKSKIFASSLWQGSRGQCPLTMRTVAFCESLLP